MYIYKYFDLHRQGAAQYLYFIYIGKTKRVYVCVQENLKEKKGCLDGVAMRHIGKLLFCIKVGKLEARKCIQPIKCKQKKERKK